MSITTNPISQTRLKEILEYNPKTGVFTWLAKIADKVVIGSRAGTLSTNGYRFIRLNSKRYREHQLAFLYMTGSFVNQIDHIDHDTSNNAWSNLREATYATNGKNHPKTVRNKTGFVGVSQRNDGKFIARIYVNKRHKFLGVFSTLVEAITARKVANITYNFHPNHGT